MDHARKIHDTLFISNKIITYKAAAAILNVTVNEAKTILKKYLKDKKDDSLNVSYVIGGITTNNTHKITIVPAAKYEKIKSTFKNITIDHIYSIQKSLLEDWIHVFNVDDLLYDKEEKQPEEVGKVKDEPKSPVKKEDTSPVKKEATSPAKNKKATPAGNKKGGISNFFSQSQSKPSNNKTTIKKEAIENETKPKQKAAKPNALTSFMSKNKASNKENTSKVINKLSPKKEDVSMEINDSDDNEEIVKTKKRTRALVIDDEEEEMPTKCQKVDILDDPVEQSDEDLFHASDKEDTDEEVIEKEEKMETVDLKNEANETKTDEASETKTDEASETKTDEDPESDVVMYQDEDGYFVVEKKPGVRKTPRKSAGKKKDPVVEIAEKKNKKEVLQKIKKNTNQNTLFSYFQKK